MPFSESTISFAIDTSGSTLGTILQREQQSIRKISALLNDFARDAVRILPWNSQAGPVTTLSELSLLTSYGGTDPGALLDTAPCLATLKNSTLWFLITDGEIPESSLRYFAKSLSSSGLHGTACVIIVFGEVYGQPSTCNISVGVSVFAAAPDCLFIFIDTGSESCYLLQCKGTFTELLERRNQQQPVLHDKTKWDDLPQISLNDLSGIRIPKHRSLQAEEIYLEADLVVNLVDLFSGRMADRTVIDTILNSPEHIRTITLTAQTRGMVEQLRNWVVRQELDPSELLSADTPRIDEDASQVMSTLMQRMSSHYGSLQDEQEISELQSEIRAANNVYVTTLDARFAASTTSAHIRSDSIQTVLDRSESSVFQCASIGPFVQEPSVPLPSSSRRISTSGFCISNVPGKNFEASCPLCAQDKTTLALLLRDPSWTQTTRDFPAVGSKSKLAFPLAMGNFRETDIICMLLCCDACSQNIVQTGTKLGEDKVICALPLVSYSSNETAYVGQLETAFQNRFDKASTPLVFVAVLCTTLQKVEASRKENHKLLASALRWVCRDIVQAVQCQDPLTWSLSKGSGPPISRPLNDVLIKSSEEAIHAISTSYFQYPIEGFVVMTKLLTEMEPVGPQIRKTAKKAVFQMLLFHVTERFDKQIDVKGRIIVHMEMVRLLSLEHGRKDRTPALPGRRQFSSFNGIAGLTRSLFGDRKSLRDRLAVSIDDLVAASLLERDFLKAFRKLGSLFDWVESQSGHAVAIFLHYLYRTNTDSWASSEAHFLKLAKTPALAPVFLEPSEISAGNAERLVGKLPPFDSTSNM